MESTFTFPTTEAACEAAARFVVEQAQRAVQQRGRFVISLSGGTSPRRLYEYLAQVPYRDQVPWPQVVVFWGDERCVPAQDERNNARMAREALLEQVPVPSSQVFQVPTELAPGQAAQTYEQTLRDFWQGTSPRFDLVLLGLGEDAHTASLFPGTEVLAETERWVREVPKEGEYRITLTPPLLNEARNVLFLVTGSAKAEVLRTLPMAPYQPDTYPVQLIRPTDGNTYWYLDEAAAGG
ncbi:6-phosphogluconolactonase [Rhabdobacter roseus]|uniref:6-phosphogluconolactonase n=1 Tax=Rhabdobacter roseus TaxID=1655419 RepID=A0A840TSI4_9BACT|nr:6-phosphogluconolactonase [Rhabdobacter roseus]MBB5286911.1 6-phosphogluconolactonase [Rhabdobacter roseus]